jgi:hypothetical protein
MLLACGEVNGFNYDDRLRAKQWRQHARWLGRLMVAEMERERQAPARAAGPAGEREG